jgi:hypothetical protein
MAKPTTGMMNQYSCGCEVIRDSGGGYFWEPCSLHKAAPDLLESCQVANKILRRFIESANDSGATVSKDIQTAFLMTDDAIGQATE